MSAEIGRVLGGRYRLVAPIGLGASAQVFLADDVRLRRRVALKMLHEALADDVEFLRRFRAEAQAAAALSHPNVMAVYDWGDDEIAFIVTEYLGGGSLRALLDKGDLLSPSQALAVGLEAARALDYAHRRGFVHRDIKPANLLFGEDQRLRIADFGLARALAEAAWTEPQGAMLGTARYASPEQAKGEKLSGKADVYALALVLIEAVTGDVPFTTDTTLGTLMARVDRPLEVPDALGPLQKVLQKAGRADPEARIDARAMAAGLLRAAKQLPRPEALPLAGALNPAGLSAPDIDPTVHAPLLVKETEPDLTSEDLDLAPPDWVNQPEPQGIEPEPVAERVVVIPAEDGGDGTDEPATTYVARDDAAIDQVPSGDDRDASVLGGGDVTVGAGSGAAVAP
ncbi:MAG: serine/threonine protein kinase, partial [Phycisphaerales bacterium]|nr:serine/threonine protein kinase [Phycisphaerales bacterium]